MLGRCRYSVPLLFSVAALFGHFVWPAGVSQTLRQHISELHSLNYDMYNIYIRGTATLQLFFYFNCKYTPSLYFDNIYLFKA